MCIRDRCNPSDIILLRPNQQHEIHSVGDIPISQPHIHFDMWYDEYSEQVYVSYKNRDGFTPEELRMIRPDLFQGEALSTPLLHIPDLDYFKMCIRDRLCALSLLSRRRRRLFLMYKFSSDYQITDSMDRRGDKP